MLGDKSIASLSLPLSTLDSRPYSALSFVNFVTSTSSAPDSRVPTRRLGNMENLESMGIWILESLETTSRHGKPRKNGNPSPGAELTGHQAAIIPVSLKICSSRRGQFWKYICGTSSLYLEGGLYILQEPLHAIYSSLTRCSLFVYAHSLLFCLIIYCSCCGPACELLFPPKYLFCCK